MTSPRSDSPALGAWDSQAKTPSSAPGADQDPQPHGVFDAQAPLEGGGEGSASAFAGRAAETTAGYATTSAPVGLLAGSLAASTLGLVLAILFEQIAVAAVAWALAALVGLGLATLFVVKDAQRQANPWYLYKKRAVMFHRFSVVLAVVAVVAAAVRIALYVGRL
ncbi:hypothetical protein CWT12_10560 [Actinomyces sp. 432]|uniref:hypothetical protein n=1 Tax=Actinomyces sp. 432 TaxID=2057798 RepID=UPI0013738371|nr:hypothetical protein [Actinomyces sp. 432]QHO91664.1 hypothetical protein CWT12_10560 [Actinomyces sp. 432]